MPSEREREFKLDVDADVVIGLPDLGRVLVEVQPEQALDATYYDTVDLRLARWGVTLRSRRSGAGDEKWTLKLPIDDDGTRLVRDEVSVEADGTAPPRAAGALVASLTRGAAIVPVATLRTQRRATVLSIDGQPFAELVDDRVDAHTSDGEHRAFREIELEVTDDAPSTAIDAVLTHLRASGARHGDAVPKLVRAIGERAQAAPDVVVEPTPRKATARQVVQSTIATSVRQLLVELPAARVGDDPEGVHQARVAVRRLRSDLQTFRPLLDRGWSEPLRDELRWLGGVLGAVRDDDVHIEVLQGLDAAPALIDELQRQRDRHRAELGRALDSRRARTLLDALVDAARDPRTTEDADGRAAPVLRPLVQKRWKKLRRAVADLGDEPAPEELHAVRILAKRCRYATMAVRPAFRGDDADNAARFAKALGKLQDELGALNDTAVITERLETLRTHRDRAVVFAAGEAVGRLRAEHAEATSRWARAWTHASRPKLRSWL